MQRTIRTPDGRMLAAEEYGDPGGRPVLVHMGTPNSRHLYGPVAADAADRGLRLISYDRPGYGGSTPRPGRTAADCVMDVRAICAALGISKIAMWGISGGGPHVLACAALLPGLVTAAACLGSPSPYPADGLDYFAGMGQQNVDDWQLMLRDPPAARGKLDQQREQILTATTADLAGQLKSVLSPVDAAVLAGNLADHLAAAWRDGLAPGSQGFFDDSRALAIPWGFDLASISVPVLVMHGRHDQFVPCSHGQWLAGRIPGADARMLDHDGHLTLLTNRIGAVHSWLAGHSW